MKIKLNTNRETFNKLVPFFKRFPNVDVGYSDMILSIMDDNSETAKYLETLLNAARIDFNSEIDESKDKPCFKCQGTGKMLHPYGPDAEKGKRISCRYCGGSGRATYKPSKKLKPWKPGPKFEAVLGALGASIPSELQKVYNDYNSGKMNWKKLGSELERLMWKSRGTDPKFFGGMKKIIDRWKQRDSGQESPLVRLKDEGYGWGDPHKKDPKRAFPGAHWTVKFDESVLNENKNMKQQTISRKELNEVIKELVSEMWVGWEEDKKINETMTSGQPIPKDTNKVSQLIFSLKEGEYIWFSFDKEGRSSHGYGIEKKVEGDEYVYTLTGPPPKTYYETDEDVERFAQEVVSDPHAHYYFIGPIQGYKKRPYEGDPDHDIGDYEMHGPDQPSWKELYNENSIDPSQQMNMFQQIQSAAYWMKKNMGTGKDIRSAVDLIINRIDDLIISHKANSTGSSELKENEKKQNIVINIIDKVKKKKEEVKEGTTHKVGDKFRFSRVHKGEMEVVKILGKDKSGQQMYRVRLPSGRETVISKR